MDKDEPLVSFLLPAYKATYFAEALQSIKNQTYSNFVCMISDDCSPEDLFDIFLREVGDDKRFTFRRNDSNLGANSLVSHWNLLVSKCSTEFFVLASDDDVYDIHFLERMMESASKYPEVNLFRSRCRIIDKDGVVQQEDALSDEYESQEVFLYRFWNQRIICIGNYMFRTNNLRSTGGFVEFPLAWGSDTATIMNVCSKGVAAPRDILFSFRNSGFNISTTYDARTIRLKHKAYFELHKFLSDYFNNWHIDETPLNRYQYSVIKRSFFNLMYDLTVNQWVYTPSELITYYKKVRKLGRISALSAKLFFFWGYAKNRLIHFRELKIGT